MDTLPYPKDWLETDHSHKCLSMFYYMNYCNVRQGRPVRIKHHISMMRRCIMVKVGEAEKTKKNESRWEIYKCC